MLRVDRRSFTHFTETGFEKPIDNRFQQMMRQTAQALLKEEYKAFILRFLDTYHENQATPNS